MATSTYYTTSKMASATPTNEFIQIPTHITIGIVPSPLGSLFEICHPPIHYVFVILITYFQQCERYLGLYVYNYRVS